MSAHEAYEALESVKNLTLWSLNLRVHIKHVLDTELNGDGQRKFERLVVTDLAVEPFDAQGQRKRVWLAEEYIRAGFRLGAARLVYLADLLRLPFHDTVGLGGPVA